MSTEINKAFVQQFSDNLIHLAQQKGSKLAGAVMRKSVVGKYSHFDRLGATVAQARTTRHGDTPLIDTPHSRRRLILTDYEVADLIDSQDELRMLIDPKSDYARAMGWALGRTLDDIIIDAADGNALSIDSSDTSSNVAVVHTVDEDFITANSDVSLEKLIEAKKILMENEIPSDEELFFVLDATSIGALLNITELTSSDYATVKALVAGDINQFMGFSFIQSERLNDSSEGFKNCLAFARSALGLGMAEDIVVRMSERDDKSYSTQVYAKMTAGAVRIHEEGLVVVEAYRA